jgi:hypothetical protein
MNSTRNKRLAKEREREGGEIEREREREREGEGERYCRIKKTISTRTI